ncbi:MAG TPA: DUF3604 domain-containing protein [Hyphomicrobiaceae bacterium]|jgi:hypothetical protein
MPFSTYHRERVGAVAIEPRHPLVAGSLEEITITYTAGDFGVDDSGAIKISWRTASDSSRPQFSDPKAPNYTTAVASNGAKLALEYNRNNIRPWVATLLVRVTNGFLRKGDTLAVRLGDRRNGCPGYRLQTAVESAFYFKVFADAFATYDFVEVPGTPPVDLAPGRPERFKAILPTLRRVGQPFRLAVLAEDRWGNVSDKVDRKLDLRPTRPVSGLPSSMTFRSGNGPQVVANLIIETPGDLRIDLHDPESGERLARSNPLRAVADATLLHYWGDLHGQSGETVGSGTAAQYFAFAKHKAFLDIVGHQGNDFQIDDAFWAEINRLAAEYDEPGEMVALPGYEWSGNTGMGGDRNVFFASEGRTIRRSSSVLLDKPASSDCHHVRDLFEALKDEDAVVIAHVGGRYADLSAGHDGRLERAVEVHSCWGTFEWLLHDAFELGHRVGVVCHSDDHKGRPGAAYPGASQFGAMGGLTCYLMPKLDRPSLFDAIRERRMYGTTGARLLIGLEARLPDGSVRLSDDPKLGPATEAPARAALMGDIVRAAGTTAEIAVEVVGSAPIERLTFFNGPKPVAEIRGYSADQIGRRIRVLFEGAEYRGRGRETFWKGTARLIGNRFTRARAINHFNADKPLKLAGDGASLDFDTVTTGNFSGFDVWLDDRDAGALDIASNMVCRRFALRDIGFEEQTVELGGLGRRMRVYRLPDENGTWQLAHTHKVELRPDADNPLYVRVTQEDGHQAWTSPVYVIP